MDYSNLFNWWAAVITAGITFLALVSIYLYARGPKIMGKKWKLTTKIHRIGVDFVFVWVLLSLLTLYIVSIGSVSSILFAIGNIVVEATLLIYLLKNAVKET